MLSNKPIIKTSFILIWITLILPSLRAQEDTIGIPEKKWTITGKVTEKYTGEELPGVIIRIEYTTIGVVTDIDGNYTIDVPDENTVLEFIYVGFTSQRVSVGSQTKIDIQLVDYYGLNWVDTGPGYRSRKNPYARERVTAKKQPDMSFVQNSRQNGSGVAVLDENSPVLTDSWVGSISEMRRFVKNRKDNSYDIRYKDASRDVLRGIEVVVSTTVGFDEKMALPALQNTYAQGEGLQWMGPHTGYTLSWGPALQNLAYDGSYYLYDVNGQLVPKGSGNQNPAHAYDASSFFRKGFRTNNNLSLRLPVTEKIYTQIDLGQIRREGIIRNSNKEGYNGGLALKGFKWNKLNMELSTAYSFSKGSLLSHGANQASVIGAVYNTPATFDNSNNMSPGNVTSPAWRLPDGRIRSYAPGKADNPYGLVMDSPDRDKTHQGLAALKMDYEYDQWTFKLYGSADMQQDERINGNFPGYSAYPEGRYSERNQRRFAATGELAASRKLFHHRMNADLAYNHRYQYDRLSRFDGFGFNEGAYGNTGTAQTKATKNFKERRNISELKYGLTFYHHRWVSAKVYNRHYFSGTAKDYLNLFPAAKVWTDRSLFRNFRISLEMLVSRNIREASLIHGGNTTAMPQLLPIESYKMYYQSQDFTIGDLHPEISINYEGSLKINWNEWRIEGTYYNTTIRDFVVQGYSNGQYQSMNAARVNTGSWNILSVYHTRLFGKIDLRLSAQWYKSNSKVVELYTNDTYLSLAGFQEVASVLAKGKPVGAIYGSTFQYDSQGRVLIVDGFPVKNPELQMIGNPEPDWTALLRPEFTWRSLSLSGVLEFRKGGQMWNGTQAVLDYTGRSQVTADQRNIKGYIFDGVSSSGVQNTQPVDFYNPQNGVSTNRWVRYGMAGVGEEYIQDSSWIRLSELKLGWEPGLNMSNISNVSISVHVKNLFLRTRYKGVDPASALFNEGGGTGLDLFNNPGIRSYFITLSMNIGT